MRVAPSSVKRSTASASSLPDSALTSCQGLPRAKAVALQRPAGRELRKDHRHAAAHGLASGEGALGGEIELLVGAGGDPGHQVRAVQQQRRAGAVRGAEFDGLKALVTGDGDRSAHAGGGGPQADPAAQKRNGRRAGCTACRRLSSRERARRRESTPRGRGSALGAELPQRGDLRGHGREFALRLGEVDVALGVCPASGG
ncbi:hypothetical protein Ddc_20489 [Ditylenchus destructor]|nr:hypothetical protein Ddc_20489 [Ditylenchus destructor]